MNQTKMPSTRGRNGLEFSKTSKRSISTYTYDSAAVMAELVRSLNHDPQLINRANLQEIADTLSELAGLPKPWGWKYVANVLHGKLHASKRMMDAILRLGAIIDGVEAAKYHRVSVLSLHEIPNDTLITSKPIRCAGCKAWFIPRSWNHKYHSFECRKNRGKYDCD